MAVIPLGVEDVHEACMRHGIEQGWWPDFNDKGPLDWPRRVSLAALPRDATMAHALHSAGFADSVSQARKAGWGTPAVLGVRIIDKKQHRIEIVL